MQMPGSYFISYSRVKSGEMAVKLADDLAAGPPAFPVWLDRRELKSGQDWDEQIVEALRSCEGLLFLMTRDSVTGQSECKKEWTRALKYKKPSIPLLFEREAELPYRLEPRQYVDFTGDYAAAIARLRKDLTWRSSPEGVKRSKNGSRTLSGIWLASRTTKAHESRMRSSSSRRRSAISKRSSPIPGPRRNGPGKVSSEGSNANALRRSRSADAKSHASSIRRRW
jgi:hypothetical protein